MNFDWKEYLQIAQYFKQLSLKKSVASIQLSEEAINRAGVSRAYYAIFCLCRNKAFTEGFFLDKRERENVHSKLISFYKKRNTNLSRYLRRLKEWRCNCDYDEKLPKDSFYLLDNSIKLACETLKLVETKNKKTSASV